MFGKVAHSDTRLTEHFGCHAVLMYIVIFLYPLMTFYFKMFFSKCGIGTLTATIYDMKISTYEQVTAQRSSLSLVEVTHRLR